MTITRRAAIRGLAMGIAAAPAVARGRYSVFAQSTVQYSARTIRLIEEAIVVDLLNQFMFPHQEPQGLPLIRRWLTEPQSFTAADASMFLDSGINVFCLGNGPRGPNQEVMNAHFAEWNGFIAAHPEWLIRIDDATDFDRVKRERKIGVMLTLQDSAHFDNQLLSVDRYYALGQRISQLTYNYQNVLGSGVLENRDGGLTVMGHAMIARMERVGMAVDLSHCADQTTLDALDAATRPLLITHSTCRALIPGHPRAKTDEMIRKMAAKGGMMGLAFMRFYIRDREPVNIGHVIDHVDHIRALVGVEHIGVGSDFDMIGAPSPLPFPRRKVPVFDFGPNGDRMRPHIDPEFPHPGIKGLEHAKRMFDFTEALIGRGYSDNEIKAILGGNAVRVLTAAWTKRN